MYNPRPVRSNCGIGMPPQEHSASSSKTRGKLGRTLPSRSVCDTTIAAIRGRRVTSTVFGNFYLGTGTTKAEQIANGYAKPTQTLFCILSITCGVRERGSRGIRRAMVIGQFAEDGACMQTGSHPPMCRKNSAAARPDSSRRPFRQALRLHPFSVWAPRTNLLLALPSQRSRGDWTRKEARWVATSQLGLSTRCSNHRGPISGLSASSVS